MQVNNIINFIEEDINSINLELKESNNKLINETNDKIINNNKLIIKLLKDISDLKKDKVQELTKKRKFNIHYFYESPFELEHKKRIIEDGEVGDEVHYCSNNQLGILIYKISYDEEKNKILRIIGDYGGIYGSKDYINF